LRSGKAEESLKPEKFQRILPTEAGFPVYHHILAPFRDAPFMEDFMFIGSTLLTSFLFLPLAIPPQNSTSPIGPSPIEASQTHGLPGRLPGTERWLVVFKDRSFDLRAFRAAVKGKNVALVDQVVKDLETKAKKDQLAFSTFVETKLQGDVIAQFWLVNACAIEVPFKNLNAIRNHPRVAYIHPDEEVLPVILTATNSKNHSADSVQAMGIKGKGVSVAIMDTGCDVNMRGSGRPHSTFYVNGDINNKTGGGIGGSRLLAAKALGKMGADDVHNHGTAVAGIAAGEKWNKNSNSDRGHAPLSGIVSYSIANNTGGGSDFITISKAWQAIAADAVKYKIVAANNSYSGSPDPTNVSQMALDAAALNAGVLPVCAAGNFSSSTRVSQSVANGLAVGATVKDTRVMATFSSRGPLSGDTKRFYPDLCAVGVSLIQPLRDNEGSQWVASGTSMASPEVCGAAALFRSVNTKASNLLTKAAILTTTEDVSKKNPNPPYNTRNAYGVGFLRDDKLISLAQGKGLLKEGVMTSATKTFSYTFVATKGKAYAATVTWHRSKLKVKTWSDLKLEAKFGSTVIASSDTPRNLYEKVVFLASQTGPITLVVTGKTLDATKVPFALAEAETPAPFINGAITVYGKGCPGTAKLPVTVPGPFVKKFGGSTDSMPLGFLNHRLMEIFDASATPSTFTATALRFRSTTIWRSVTNYWVELEVKMGLSKNSPAFISSTFASNIDGSLVTVIKKKKINLPDVKGPNSSPFVWGVRIPLDQPYTHKAKAGKHLLVDFVRSNSSSGSFPADYFSDAANDQAGKTISRVWSLTLNSTTGSTDVGYGTILGFDTTGAANISPEISSTSTPEIGLPLKIDFALAKSQTPVLLSLSLSNSKWNGIPLPLDLTPFGASGCKLLAGLDIIFVGTANKTGSGSFSFPIPLDKTLIQLNTYFQSLVIDPGANNLGLAFSNGINVRFGGQP
jgi:major intracellular serine protease